MKLFGKSPQSARREIFTHKLLLLTLVALAAQSAVIFASASAGEGVAAVAGYLGALIPFGVVVAAVLLTLSALAFIMKIGPGADSTKELRNFVTTSRIVLVSLIIVVDVLLVVWAWSRLNIASMLAGPVFFVGLAIFTWMVTPRTRSAGRPDKNDTRSGGDEVSPTRTELSVEDRPAGRTTPPRGTSHRPSESHDAGTGPVEPLLDLHRG